MTAPEPGMSELTRVFARIGVLSFGGPAAQIALMHRELVDTRHWLSEQRFLSALSFTMLLPGPEAMQLATYAGWRLHGVRGGLVAGGLFVLPGALLIMALAALYVAFGQVPLVGALFFGIKAAVVAIVLEALVRLARRALVRPAHWMIAGLAFLAIFAFGLPFPAIIAMAGLWGALAVSAHGTSPQPPLPRATGSGRTLAVWGGLWSAPVAVLWVSGATFLTDVALFFSKLAVVTFGGAYAVLAYMAQETVQDRGWLTTPQMMDALGLAETTPGPLILVTEFVGFLAGFGAGGWPLAAAAACVTLWVTFVPCFLWIFVGAPYLEWITAKPRLAGALAAITAAVVGVILNLSLWFAVHVLFSEVGVLRAGPVLVIRPDVGTLDPVAVALVAGAALALMKFRWPLPAVLAGAALAGAALSFTG